MAKLIKKLTGTFVSASADGAAVLVARGTHEYAASSPRVPAAAKQTPAPAPEPATTTGSRRSPHRSG